MAHEAAKVAALDHGIKAACSVKIDSHVNHHTSIASLVVHLEGANYGINLL